MALVMLARRAFAYLASRAPVAALASVAVCLLASGCGEERATAVRDTTPPGAITDLGVLEVDSTWVRLTWTAPEDGAGGAAARYDLRYAATDTVAWDRRVEIPLPAPRAPGEREDHRVTGLSPGTFHVFRIRAADAASNVSAPSNAASTWTAGRDLVPPSRIVDLEMVASTDTSVRLRWTAPGDDGDVGIAARYELRLGWDWDSGDEVSGLPPPSPAGAIEEFTVGDLDAATERLYFRIRAEDDAGNLSPMSPPCLAFTVLPEDAAWSDRFGPPPGGNGLDWVVNALLVYDGRLIAAGGFTRAGPVHVSCIAAWDGSTWNPLGSGLNGDVHALSVYNGDLIAAGRFTHAGGVEARHIARWDGSAWHPMGSGTAHGVRALAVGEELRRSPDAPPPLDAARRAYASRPWDKQPLDAHKRLYASDGQDIHRWDGQSWTLLDAPPLQSLTGLREWEGDLYVSGYGPDEERIVWIARWDGQDWHIELEQPQPGGWVGDCGKVITFLDDAAGRLLAGWGGSAAMLCEYSAGDWPRIGPNVLIPPAVEDCISVSCATEWRGGLFAGGYFRLRGPVRSRSVAWFDGAAWNPLGSGIGEPRPGWPAQHGSVRAAVAFQGSLYVAGHFRFAGGRPAANIAAWDE